MFTKWDRFSRNAGESYQQITIFDNLGITPFAIEQPLNLKVPEQLLMLAVYLSVPEVENRRRSLNVISGMRRALKEGRYLGSTPRGYESRPDNTGRPKLYPNDLAKHIKTVFDMYASEHFSQADILDRVNKDGYYISRTQLSKILRNPIYMGYVKIKEYLDEPEHLVLGIHEPLVSTTTFYKVQDLLVGRRRNKIGSRQRVPSLKNFPLRGHLECQKCGRALCASSSKGNGGKYHYYHCTGGCKNSNPARRIHKEIDNILSGMKLDKRMAGLYVKELEDQLNEKGKFDQAEKDRREQEITSLKNKLLRTQDLYIEGELSKDDYDEIKARYKTQIDSIQLESSPVDTASVAERIEALKWGIGFVDNLQEYYNNKGVEGKRLIIGSMFPKKFIFENNEARTNEVGILYSLLCSNSKGYKRIKKRDNLKNIKLSRSVLGAGLEPARSQ